MDAKRYLDQHPKQARRLQDDWQIARVIIQERGRYESERGGDGAYFFGCRIEETLAERGQCAVARFSRHSRAPALFPAYRNDERNARFRQQFIHIGDDRSPFL